MSAARCAVWAALLCAAIGSAHPAVLFAQPAPAEPGQNDAEAEYAHLVSGALSEFEQGRWEQARTWFERAHALRPNARTLWGLGITAFELGRYAQAIEELEIALGDTRLPLSDAQRAQAQDVIARAARHVTVLSIELAPERAVLSLDGAETEERQLILAPGHYTLAARAPGFRERELRVEATPGEKRVVRFELPPIPLGVRRSPVRQDAAATPPPRADDGSVLESWWLWTAVAVVVAGGVTALLVVGDGDGDDDSGPKVNIRREVLTRRR